MSHKNFQINCTPVEVCDSRENPITEAVCITGAVFLEVKDGDSIVVLQTE